MSLATVTADQIAQAAGAVARSNHTWLIVRPLGATPTDAPGVAIAARDHLGLIAALNRAEELYPHASAWEIAGADRKTTRQTSGVGANGRDLPLAIGEITLMQPLVIATLGLG